jgi:hypothetical protein
MNHGKIVFKEENLPFLVFAEQQSVCLVQFAQDSGCKKDSIVIVPDTIVKCVSLLCLGDLQGPEERKIEV